MDNKIHTLNEICYLAYNDGYGWKLWSGEANTFLYWKQVIETIQGWVNCNPMDFKILVELDRR